MPTELAEGGFVAEVAGLVSLDLGFPPIVVGLGEAEVGAVFVAVPEAAVDEDDGVVFGKDEVRSAGEVFVFRAVDGEAVAEAVEHGAEDELGFCIAATDAGHDFGSLLRCEDVHGGSKN